MNTLTTLSSILLKSAINVNSFQFINSTKSLGIVLETSGSAFSNNLGAAYWSSAIGINPTNENTTCLTLRNGTTQATNTTMLMPNGVSSNFTVYLKHASRFYTDSIFGHGYALASSATTVFAGNPFTVTFYSLYPTINLPYTISGVLLSDLSGTSSLTGTFTSNYQAITFNTSSSITSTKNMVITYGTQSTTANIYKVNTTYAVTVSGGVFNINGLNQNLTFVSGNVYVFDQSSPTNIGNLLVLGTTVDVSSSIVGNNVIYNGTPGSANAYTLIDFGGTNPATTALKYFSLTTTGMGFLPISPIADFDATISSNITSVSGLVSNWTSKNGTISASQSTQANKPTLTANYINTYPAIVFNNTSTYLTVNNTGQTSSAITVFFVVSFTNLKANFSPILTTTGDWTVGSLHINLGNNMLQVATNTNGNPDLSPPEVFSTNTPYLFAITINLVNGSYINFKLNGTNGSTSVSIPSGITSSINTNFTIGGWINSSNQNRFFGGVIGELLFYNTLLSTSQIQSVEGYLAWRWGLQNNLPTIHPYKTSSTNSSQFV